ncbi:MAG TPA: sterol desaturase family protein [Polyangiaceae bacterium]|jgi:sterol desaturase/sphingolipid hydroxylase (fatty acid hydroxylase superfamily)|nr:sterol desaturase family protein [Polyangiaceae bacterium]
MRVHQFAWYEPLLFTACWALSMAVLERLYPADPRQKFFREGFVLDFFWYTLFEGALMGFVIGLLITKLDGVTGWSRLRLVSGWPIAAQLAFFWVTHDFYIYWFHRLQHKNRYLWRTHEAHHSGKDVDFLSGSRSHCLEILINQTIEYAPITLLGAHPSVAVMKGMLDAAWGMYIHSNIGVRMGGVQFVLNGPEMHRWHHAADNEREHNFATKIALWDWIFGTAYKPDATPKKYGLFGEPWFPKGYFAQHLWAFRPLERAAALGPAKEAMP